MPGLRRYAGGSLAAAYLPHAGHAGDSARPRAVQALRLATNRRKAGVMKLGEKFFLVVGCLSAAFLVLSSRPAAAFWMDIFWWIRR